LSLCKSKETAGFTIFLALESCAMIGFWIYMLTFLIRDNHQASATLIAIALFANWVINYLWWEYYNDKLYKNDKEFQDFSKKFPLTISFIKLVCLLVSFDFFRIIYSHMFDLM